MLDALLEESLVNDGIDNINTVRLARGGAFLNGWSTDATLNAMLTDETSSEYKPWNWVVLQGKSLVVGLAVYYDTRVSYCFRQ